MIAEVELLTGWRILRGIKVNKAIPDGTVLTDGKRSYLEIDNSGKMSLKQYTAKWRRYGNVDGFILVVAHSEARMQRIRKGAALIKNVALFTTFARLKAAEKTAVDWFGNETQL